MAGGKPIQIDPERAICSGCKERHFQNGARVLQATDGSGRLFHSTREVWRFGLAGQATWVFLKLVDVQGDKLSDRFE